MTGLNSEGNIQVKVVRNGFTDWSVMFGVEQVVSVEERPIQVGDKFMYDGKPRWTIAAIYEHDGVTYTAYTSESMPGACPISCPIGKWAEWGCERL
jgi:hypothetical protein